MAGSPQFKVYSSANEYVGSIKYLEDAAAFVSIQGEGATVRNGHARKLTLWTEGVDGHAGESYDEAAVTMRSVINAQHAATRAEYRRILSN
jgi:hypothetical protein